MRPRRREALGLALLSLGTACRAPSGHASRAATSAAGAAGTHLVSTSLGSIALEGDRDSSWGALLTAAASRVERVWGRADHRLRVVVCSTDEEFESAASGLGDMTAAVTTASGIYLGPSVTRSLGAAGRELVVAHELTHAVLGQVGSDRTALWVKEGAAEWTAEQGVGMKPADIWPTLAALPPAHRPGGPPHPAEFDSNAPLAYETAAAYVTYLVERSGRAAFCRFVRTRPPEAKAQRDVDHMARGGKTFTVWLNERL